MSKFNDKELDAVLNQLKIEPSFIRLKELDGDINSNHFIVDDLEKDGYVKVDRMTNNDLNHISLTVNGDAFKKTRWIFMARKKGTKAKMGRKIVESFLLFFRRHYWWNRTICIILINTEVRIPKKKYISNVLNLSLSIFLNL